MNRCKIKDDNIIKTVVLLYELTGNIKLISQVTGISKPTITKMLEDKDDLILLFGKKLCNRTINNLRVINDIKNNKNLDKHKEDRSLPQLIYNTKKHMLDYFDLTLEKNNKRDVYIASKELIRQIDNKEITLTKIAAMENVSVPAISRRIKRHREKIRQEELNKGDIGMNINNDEFQKFLQEIKEENPKEYKIEECKFNIAKNLTIERESQGLSVEDLSLKSGLSIETIKSLEMYGDEPCLDSYIRYIDALDVDINTLSTLDVKKN